MGDDPRAGVRVVYQTQEQVEASISDAAAKFEKLKEQILVAVRKHTNLRSKNAICERVSGTRSTKLNAIQELIDEKRLIEVNGVFRIGRGQKEAA